MNWVGKCGPAQYLKYSRLALRVGLCNAAELEYAKMQHDRRTYEHPIERPVKLHALALGSSA
jgi:hypothetical protein